MADDKTLVLKPTHGFEIHINGDELGRGGEYKYYQNQAIALQDGKGKGSTWGGDAEARHVNYLYTDGTDLYTIEKLGPFVDAKFEYKEKTIAKIKAKLTEEELKLLGL